MSAGPGPAPAGVADGAPPRPGARSGLPPGPSLPVFAQTALWVRRPTRLMEGALARYGDPFTLRLAGMGPLVFTCDPASIHAVFRDSGERLRAGEGNAPLGPVLGPHSVFLLDGAEHMAQRRLLLPAFHGQRMRAYGATMREVVEEAIAAWRPTDVLDAHPVTQSVSAEIIIRVVFGIAPGPRRARCAAILGRYMRHLTGSLVYMPVMQHDLGPWSPWGRFRRAGDALAALLDEEIDERRRGADIDERRDILSVLLAAQPEWEEGMSAAIVREQLITLLAAGHETTATALVWALRHVLRHPDVEARLVAEIDALGPDADPDALAALPYLDAVCRESLRLFPVVPVVGRRVRGEFTLGAWVIPDGATVVPCIHLVHRRPDLYPQPDRFVPERFLEREYAPHEYLPFGGGIRRCIGASFALYEMKIAFGTLLSRFRLELVSPGPPVAVRRHVTLFPRGGARLRVRERRW